MNTNTLQAIWEELASKDATYKKLLLDVPMRIRVQTLPQGWKHLIHDFLMEFNENRNDWLIEQFKEEWGSLVIELITNNRSKLSGEIDSLRLHYALKSQKTCMHCGANGKRHIIDNRLVVSCAQHNQIASTSTKTGTWLDKY